MDEQREYDICYLDDLHIGENVVFNNTRARMLKRTTEQIFKCFVNLIGRPTCTLRPFLHRLQRLLDNKNKQILNEFAFIVTIFIEHVLEYYTYSIATPMPDALDFPKLTSLVSRHFILLICICLFVFVTVFYFPTVYIEEGRNVRPGLCPNISKHYTILRIFYF